MLIPSEVVPFLSQGAEDYQTILTEKENLLAELRSENLTKDMENRKLQQRMKRTHQELADLKLERDRLAKELEEAQLQKTKSDKTINVNILFSSIFNIENSACEVWIFYIRSQEGMDIPPHSSITHK